MSLPNCDEARESHPARIENGMERLHEAVFALQSLYGEIVGQPIKQSENKTPTTATSMRRPLAELIVSLPEELFDAAKRITELTDNIRERLF